MPSENPAKLSPEQIEKAKSMGVLYYEIGLALNLNERKRQARKGIERRDT